MDLAYSRDEEVPTPWAVSSLRDFNRAQQFYRLRDFHLYKRRPIAFPENVMLSRNYFNPRWSGHRRMKNVIVTMEWIPNATELLVRDTPYEDYGAYDRASALKSLATTIQLLSEHQHGFKGTLVREFVEVALGHPSNAASADWDSVMAKAADADGVLGVLSSNFLRHEQVGALHRCPRTVRSRNDPPHHPHAAAGR